MSLQRSLAALVLAAGIALVVPATTALPASTAATPPNIVFVFLDDARVDDVAAAMPLVQRRIGDAGATFTRFYAPFPLCCPARASLLTGRYAHNHGVLSNQAPTGGFAEFRDSSTLATWLTPTYRTGHIGKYLNQAPTTYVPPGWDEWIAPRSTYGYTGTKWFVKRAGTAGTTQDVPGYQTDTMGTMAADFIGRNAPAAEPYFLYTSIVAPHAGNPTDPDDLSGYPTPYVKPEYRNTFSGMSNTDPSFNEADVSDKPVRPSLLSSAEIKGLTETLQQRRESMRSAQDAMMRILDAVAASGEAANTVVAFSSDNGYMIGEHRIRGGKVAPYEVANRVPFLVSGPGIPAGTIVREATGQVDVAPTVLALAGVTTSAPIDGVSLVPLLTGGSTSLPREAVLLEATNTSSSSDPLPWLYRGVVDGQWKYIERETGKRELYDFQSDPYELQNRAGQAAYAATQQRLASALARLKSCAGAECR